MHGRDHTFPPSYAAGIQVREGKRREASKYCGARLAANIAGFGAPAARAADPAQPAISAEAAAALLRMGHSLQAPKFSLTAQTIRVYSTTNGEFLHIFHTIKAVLHRPNRLMAEVIGDDGSSKIVFDGKAAWIYSGRNASMRRS